MCMLLVLAGCGSGEPLCETHQRRAVEENKDELQSHAMTYIRFIQKTNLPMPKCPECLKLMDKMVREGRVTSG